MSEFSEKGHSDTPSRVAWERMKCQLAQPRHPPDRVPLPVMPAFGETNWERIDAYIDDNKLRHHFVAGPRQKHAFAEAKREKNYQSSTRGSTDDVWANISQGILRCSMVTATLVGYLLDKWATTFISNTVGLDSSRIGRAPTPIRQGV